MSRFDAFVARWAGFGYYETAPDPVPDRVREFAAECERHIAASVATTYADTRDEVEAAELDVIGELSALVESSLSPLEACRQMFNPINERT